MTLCLCSAMEDLGWAAAFLLVPAQAEEVPANISIFLWLGDV